MAATTTAAAAVQYLNAEWEQVQNMKWEKKTSRMKHNNDTMTFFVVF